MVPCSEVQLARSFMGVFESQLLAPEFTALLRDPNSRTTDVIPVLDLCFLYSLVWSVGAVIDDAGRRAYTVHLRKATQKVHKLESGKLLKFERSCHIPEGGQDAHEYYVD